MPIPKEYLGTAILSVDDELSMRITINNMLLRMGFKNLMMAENGKKALEIIQAKHIDIVIADINMPIMNGIELFKAVKENLKYQHINFIFVTAEATRQVVARAAEDGGEAYIIKPFIMSTVEEKLEKILEKKHKPNELDQFFKNYERFLQTKEYDKAEQELMKAKAIIGDTAKISFNMARLTYLQGDINKAIELYKECINKNPMFVKAYNAIGEIYENIGEIQSAIRYYEIAHEISPANTERIITLSKLLHKTGDTEKAGNILKSAATDIRGDVSTSQHLLGEIYMSKNEYDKALECFTKAHKQNPTDITIMSSLANAYRMLSKHEHALMIYNKILEVNHDNSEAYYEMSKTYLEMGNKQKAIENMKKAWELNPFSKQITADLRALARQDKVAL